MMTVAFWRRGLTVGHGLRSVISCVQESETASLRNTAHQCEGPPFAVPIGIRVSG